MKVLGSVQAALVGVTAVIASMATVVPVSASTPLVSSPPKVAAATTQVRADFDGDGRSDTAVGINPFHGPNAPSDTPGTRVWLSADPSRHTDFLYGAGGLPRGTGIIWGLATGNFNGDAYADLAMLNGAGVGVVLYGSPTGLGDPHPFDAPTDAMALSIQASAAADVNGDGFDDLVVRSEDDPGGALTVFDGSTAGLSPIASQHLLRVPMATALVGVGDFNGDGFDDAAVTAGTSDCATTSPECGSAIVTLYGSAAGLRQPAGSAVGFGLQGRLLSAADDVVPIAQVADFNQDGYDDVAIETAAGELSVFAGGTAGLSSKPSSILAVAGTPVAVGDLNGDGFPDLEFSGEPEVPRSPRLSVVLGSRLGLRAAGALVMTVSQLDLPGGPVVAMQAVGLLDVTGDGKADVVAQAKDGRMFFVPGTATGFARRNVALYAGGGFGPIAVSRLTPKSHPTGAATATDVTSQPATATPAGQSPRHVTGDVNGDGFADLVIGHPGADVGSISTAGQVVVVPGSAHGFRYARARTVSAASPGVPGDAISGEEFGATLAVGDFNGDGYADVAIDVLNAPVPGDPVYFGFTENMIDVVYGGRSGLRGDNPTPATSITDGTRDRESAPSLAVGDFDGNGYDDLAVAEGTYYHQHDFDSCAKGDALGRIAIFGGSRAGLAATPQVRTGGCALGVGATVFAADLDHDGRSDLVATGFTVAVNQDEDDGGELVANHPRIETLYGGPHGLSAIRQQHAYPVLDPDPGFDAFAQRQFPPLAVGDVNGDGHLDIVVGLPDADHNAGVVEDFLGHGRRFDHAHLISQATAGVPGHATRGSHFGWSVAVGHVDAGRFADIVVGVPFADTGSNGSAGQVIVLYTGRHGFSRRGAVIDQSSRGIGGAASTGNEFGLSVALRHSSSHSTVRLVVGVPGANHGAGGVATLRTTRLGLTTRHAEWTRESGVGLPVEPVDFFGYTFA